MVEDVKQATRCLLQEGRLEEALQEYQAYLKDHDDDLEAWLELGIAQLLVGKREKFLEIDAMFRPCLTESAIKKLGRRVQKLWAEYNRVAARFAAAAALGAVMVGAAGTSGCRQDGIAAGGAPAQAQDAGGTAEAAQPPDKVPLDGGSVAPSDPAAQVKLQPPPQPTPKPTTEPPKVVPKNRYIAIRHDKDETFQ